ncbi:DinB family protein [Segetibacter sp. 3557_3]|uniref:DinB family protein n=1 Tax=Segetibacter sp. 3557_3 TaxID=2547429 RepID=UPI001058C949|nr:DinB family protein [Segetibacter sp. 3557_3]TDH21255.1 DinB family protein [Segetibacter sp. 3557_3]
MDSKQITTDLLDSLSELINQVSSLNEAQLNTCPFHGSWTPAQVSQHLVLSNSGFLEVINGPVSEANRNPAEFIPAIKNDFLNFSIKMKSPEFVEPPDTYYNKEELIQALHLLRTGVTALVPNIDLAKICMAFEYRYMASLAG